ncbi:general transcription factor 3C polypeptide 6 [Gastrophryne carolinensis]
MFSQSFLDQDVQHSISGVNEDEEEEEEEEEHLVLVELTGIIDSDILEKCNKKCKILGINTEKPFLQVDKYVFAGEYEDTLGTCVIFEETMDHGDGDNQKPKLKYKCHTVKKLNMTRTFLSEKKEGEGGKIEWFQVKEESSASWPQMICSFAQENEEADESHSEEEDADQEQLDESIDDDQQAEQLLEPDVNQQSTSKGTATTELEGEQILHPKEQTELANEEEQSMDTCKAEGGTDKSLLTAVQKMELSSEETKSA